MASKPLVLVVDDELKHRRLYANVLEDSGFRVVEAASAEDAEAFLRTTTPNLVVSDVRMPGADGLTLLKNARAAIPGLPFLMVTAFADVREAVSALKLGAVDYLRKPVDLDELADAALDALGIVRRAPDGTSPLPLPAAAAGIVAESAAMRSLLADAAKAAAAGASILLSGESGSGKEVLARFIHACSIHPKGSFVPINCGAIPPTLIASELFGHERGAFTGAVRERKGAFREADGGTLFLDEIGEMPLEIQPALLRAVETGRVSPVGGSKEILSDFQLVAATNRNLEDDVKSKRFREDLYYRLNVISFEIPPLRERPQDILPMARHFLSIRKGGQKRLAPSTATILERHPWPGNARELSNALERAAILASAEVILPEHLPPSVRGSSAAAPPGVKSMDEAEIDAIRKALASVDNNRTKAAEILGISRRALIYKLKRWNIDRP